MNFSKTTLFILLALMLASIIILIFTLKTMQKKTPANESSVQTTDNAVVRLPSPRHFSNVSVEEALLKRRSVRDYSDQPLTFDQLSQLLWAAQGITSPEGFRTTPSAGALYPLEIYLVVKNVSHLSPGLYHYLPQKHAIELISKNSDSSLLNSASYDQQCVESSTLNIIITALESRTRNKYGSQSTRFVTLEAGHAAQNIYLQAVALNLGTVSVGAFDEEKLKRAIKLPKDLLVLYIMPVGNFRFSISHAVSFNGA